MSNTTNLYFIAILLPDQLCTRVRAIQQYIAGKFHSRKSLRVIPHITLKAPFTFKRNRNGELLSWFSGLEIDVRPFEQELRNFGSFNNTKSPVIYIKPTATESLHKLQQQVIEQFSQAFPEQPINFSEKNFSPHVTVAYRDLQPAQFREAWKEFSQYDFTDQFSVQALQLLRHDGQKWNVVETFTIS
jgi:2'-5' RNA ligase